MTPSGGILTDELAQTSRKSEQPETNSSFVEIDGERFVAIEQAQAMPSFFLTVVSANDHWFFTSSEGPLAAGRGAPDTALFPYYTVDKIIDNWNTTGPQTIIQCGKQRWEPFKPHQRQHFDIERRLLKSLNGDSVIFEETNHSLELCFGYRWQLSKKFGFVRKAYLTNLAHTKCNVRLVDGIANFLPAGLDVRTQLAYSCLADAYKLTETDQKRRLLVHRMASGFTDEAVPMESLRATVVWSHGWADSRIIASDADIEPFLQNGTLSSERQIRAARGTYLNAGELTLKPKQMHEWGQVADIQKTQSQVASLAASLNSPEALWEEVNRDIDQDRLRLESLVSSSDGQQVTADSNYCAHHRANVLFNIMRGGVFANSYTVKKTALEKYLRQQLGQLSEKDATWLNSLPATLAYETLVQSAHQAASPAALRHCQEYLPLIFSRRHGDPSRPWNQFAIRTNDENGDPIIGYEGNWRDIFQNWEALAWSFPHFNQAFIRRFLNASTADGYNPYRLTSNGMDWEKVDPEDPWATIGYWGDHQIIYLLKLLEFQERLAADGCQTLFDEDAFVFADVPYRIRSFAELARDPSHSIHFDNNADHQSDQRVATNGADGKLLYQAAGELHHAGFIEKLLIPALTKLSNFCAGGGVWMNTQRPEWNDANNALAGWGLSVVTTGYLHRYFKFLERFLQNGHTSFACHESVAEFLNAISAALADAPEKALENDRNRFALLERLGQAGESYRNRVYTRDFGQRQETSMATVQEFIARTLAHLQATLAASRRDDGLYHAYNVLHLDPDQQTAAVQHLGVMLEGQVSILSSQAISSDESLAILEALPRSELYCAKRNSYILYADKDLPSFLDFNRVDKHAAEGIGLIAELSQAGRKDLLEWSEDEQCYRFVDQHVNQFTLRDALDALAADPRFTELVQRDRAAIQHLYESTFNHRAFTGRSGSMFAYEGLGSIYWHMVSKLMLAVAELAEQANEKGDENTYLALQKEYFKVQGGLGFRKSAHDYGAFPADAYSHTPAHAGAQQPGLTGMVKEGVIARFIELGVHLEKGAIRFAPRLLSDGEFLSAPQGCCLYANGGEYQALRLPANSLLFTLAQTPVIYERTADSAGSIDIHYHNEELRSINTTTLPAELAEDILKRTGRIDHLHVRLPQ
ncbi:MAG: hypothetical protein ACQKBV_01625 [Puniceicoccales bacterium]